MVALSLGRFAAVPYSDMNSIVGGTSLSLDVVVVGADAADKMVVVCESGVVGLV